MTPIKLNGIEYVEKNYTKIVYSNWNPRVFVIGFFSGCVIISIFLWGAMFLSIN